MRWWWLAMLYAVPAFAQSEVKNLDFRVLNLEFVVANMGGTAKGLNEVATKLETKETPSDIRIELAADVLFDFDRANLRPAGVEALQQVATMIRERRNRGVRIEGHTDSKGTVPYNQRLSEERAKTVRDWFQQNGLTDVRFTIEAFGARRPVATNTRPDGSDDPEGRQKNRRVEIIIVKG
jgi:outer membrane protein OmpA-like peptidoglycan-associated protein